MPDRPCVSPAGHRRVIRQAVAGRVGVVGPVGGGRLDPLARERPRLRGVESGAGRKGQGMGRAEDPDRAAHRLDPVDPDPAGRFLDQPRRLRDRDRRLRSRRDDDPRRGEQSAVGHPVDGIDPVMIIVIGIDAAVDGAIEGRGDPVAVLGACRRGPALADHADIGDAARGRPGQLGVVVADLDAYVLDVGEEDERAERDRSDRVDPIATAQHGITDRLAGRDERVVELAGADLGDPGAVGGMLERAVALADDGEGEWPQAVGGRGRPDEADPVAEHLGVHRGGRVGRSPGETCQGVGQVGGDVQGLAVEVSRRGRVGPFDVPGLARSASARRRPGVSSDQAAWISGDSGSAIRLQDSIAARAAESLPPARDVS